MKNNIFEKIYEKYMLFYYKENYKPNTLLIGHNDYRELKGQVQNELRFKNNGKEECMGMEVVRVFKDDFLNIVHIE